MKPLRIWVIGLILSLMIGGAVVPAFAQVTEIFENETDNPYLGGCGVGEIIITEIDYDEPGKVDKYEFVELNGEPYSDLSRYELRFVSEDRSPIETISLEGLDLGRSGYFVVSSDNLNVYDEAEHLIVDEEDFIKDTAGGVGLYDLEDEQYCSFINYERTIDGYGDWVIIGSDEPEDGIGRGCRRSLAGWWSCRRIATPGGSNTVVSVAVSSLWIESSTSRAPMAIFGIVGLGAIGAFVWTRRK